MNRLALVERHRAGRALVHRLKRSLRSLQNMLDTVTEQVADDEEEFAVELLLGGPIEHEGRRYEHETRDGCDCVRVRPIDAYLLIETEGVKA